MLRALGNENTSFHGQNLHYFQISTTHLNCEEENFKSCYGQQLKDALKTDANALTLLIHYNSHIPSPGK